MVIKGALPENNWFPKKFSEQMDEDEHGIPFASVPPAVNWISNPPFSIDGKKTTAEGAMFTANPLRVKAKLLIAVVSISPVPLRLIAGAGFGNVMDSDQVSLGALQLLVAAPLRQTPVPVIVAESALAPATPNVTMNRPSIIVKTQGHLRMILSHFLARHYRVNRPLRIEIQILLD